MSKALSEALNRLADVAELQLQATREQMARDSRRDMQERMSRPEFRAEFAAKQRPLRPMGAAAIYRGIPGLGSLFTGRVPPEFFTQTSAELLTVCCPCGGEHEVGLRGFPHAGGCGRYFMYDGEEVRVAFTPEPEAVEPSSSSRQES